METSAAVYPAASGAESAADNYNASENAVDSSDLDLSRFVRSCLNLRMYSIMKARFATVTEPCTLTLDYTSLDFDRVEALAVLVRFARIKSLDLSSTYPQIRGVQILGDALAKSSVTKLRMCRCTLSAMSLALLVWFLRDTSIITDLDLSENGLSDEGAQALAAGLVSLSKVRILSVQKCMIQSSGAAALARALRDSYVTSLDLKDNAIRDSGVESLGRHLPSSSLTFLNLANNQISSASISVLASGIARSTLQVLNLSYNDLRDAGVSALASVLAKTALVSLFLGSNSVGLPGAQSLAKNLKGSCVKHLYLEENRVGDRGAKALSAVFSLVSLHLSNNCITVAGAKTLSDMVNTSDSLLTLCLSRNPLIPQDLRTSIEDRLMAKKSISFVVQLQVLDKPKWWCICRTLAGTVIAEFPWPEDEVVDQAFVNTMCCAMADKDISSKLSHNLSSVKVVLPNGKLLAFHFSGRAYRLGQLL